MSPPHPLVSELDIRRVEQRAKELPVAGYRRGYRVAQVDGFLGRAVASLRARLAENEGLRAGVDPGNLWHQRGLRQFSPHARRRGRADVRDGAIRIRVPDAGGRRPLG